MAFLRTFSVLTVIQAAFAAGITWAIAWADQAYPPPLDKAAVASREVLDGDGALLRAFTTPDSKWRLAVKAENVDPQFIKMLIAYEDQRFNEHRGIDLWAIGRAGWQIVTHGRIVSGGSTLSMQVARLIEPREGRSFSSKFLQMARAVQIERRLSKAEILNLYLNLAPYGGNLEGIRSASLAYYGKEPKRLSVAESAMLVALPQLPERRRPDRYKDNAEAARERVLKRLAVASIIGDGEAERALVFPIPHERKALPALAAHLSETALRKWPDRTSHKTTLRRDVQRALEEVALKASKKLGDKLSIAIVMADAKTGEILGEVGSADYFAQPGLGREGTLWLVEQGVKIIGIDAYTLDRPFANMVADYQRTGDGRYIWPAHFAGITREYCQIEKLANLDRLPAPYGFTVSCLPVKIERASAAWCRAVAIVE